MVPTHDGCQSCPAKNQTIRCLKELVMKTTQWFRLNKNIHRISEVWNNKWKAKDQMVDPDLSDLSHVTK